MTSPTGYASGPEAASAALIDRAATVVPGGVHSGRRRTDPPFCFTRAAGAYLEDASGRQYIDYRCGAGAVILGHGHAAVADKVAQAARGGVLLGVGTTEDEVRLADRIVAHVPSIQQVLFCNSGSEATYHALRLARAVTGRPKIVKFQGCYHGFHDYVLLNCESRPEMIGRLDPHSAGMLPGAIESTLVCRYNDLPDVVDIFARHSGEIAAIIVEPIAHNGPGITPVPGFLEGLRTLCDSAGALLIFDEVITGYRHHVGGYQAICNVLPDLTTLGKAIANGYPLAALGGRRELMSRFTTRPGGDTVWSGTYNANAISVAAALATTALLEDGSVHAHIAHLGTMMRSGLRDIAQRLGAEATVCGYGSLFSLWFADGPIRTYDDVARNDNSLFTRYRREMLLRGIFEYPDTDGARSHIGLSHTVSDVERTLAAATLALRAALTLRE